MDGRAAHSLLPEAVDGLPRLFAIADEERLVEVELGKVQAAEPTRGRV